MSRLVKKKIGGEKQAGSHSGFDSICADMTHPCGNHCFPFRLRVFQTQGGVQQGEGNEGRIAAMGHDIQQMNMEIESMRKARNDMEEKLVNTMEMRAAKLHENENKTKLKKERDDGSGSREGDSSEGTRSPSTISRSTSRRGRRPVAAAPKEVHWSGTKGKGKKGKGSKGRGDSRDGKGENQRRERTETSYPSTAGGRSNTQRLYSLENDQAENLVNDERMRKDIEYSNEQAKDSNELSKRTAREMDKLTRTLEKVEARLDKLENKEKNKKSKSNKDNLTRNHGQGGDPGVHDRQARRGCEADGTRRRSS